MKSFLKLFLFLEVLALIALAMTWIVCFIYNEPFPFYAVPLISVMMLAIACFVEIVELLSDWLF